jgi:hypothetical protein
MEAMGLLAFVLLCFLFSVLGMESRPLHLPNEPCTTELQSSPHQGICDFSVHDPLHFLVGILV